MHYLFLILSIFFALKYICLKFPKHSYKLHQKIIYKNRHQGNRHPYFCGHQTKGFFFGDFFKWLKFKHVVESKNVHCAMKSFVWNTTFFLLPKDL